MPFKPGKRSGGNTGTISARVEDCRALWGFVYPWTQMIDTQAVIQSEPAADLPRIHAIERHGVEVHVDKRVEIAFRVSAGDDTGQHIGIGIARGTLAPVGILQLAVHVAVARLLVLRPLVEEA